jgi:hypothetical protein
MFTPVRGEPLKRKNTTLRIHSHYEEWKLSGNLVDRDERGGRITCSEDRVKALDREAGADQH